MSEFLAEVGVAVSRALAPLRAAIESEVMFAAFLRQFGWDVTFSPGSITTIRAGFAFQNLFQAVDDAVDALESGTGDELAAAEALTEAVGAVVEAVRDLENNPPGGLPFPLDQNAFWSEFPGELVDLLLVSYLERRKPVLYAFLLAMGVITYEAVTPMGGGRVPYTRIGLDIGQLGTVLNDPAGAFADVYGWGGTAGSFDHVLFVESLALVADALGLFPRLEPPVPSLTTPYYDTTNPTLPAVRQLNIPLYSDAEADWTNYVEFGITILAIPPAGQKSAAPEGFLLAPLVTAAASPPQGDPGEGLTLELTVGFDAAGAFAAAIRPDGVDLVFGAGPSIEAGLAFYANPPTPWILLGAPNSHRLELGGAFAGVEVKGTPADAEVILEAGTGRAPTPRKLALVVQFSDGDSFLQRIFGAEEQRMEFAGSVRWSSKTGFALLGQATLRIVIPINKSIGPVELRTLLILVEPTIGGASAVVAISGSLALGPIAASVEEIGVRARLVPVAAGEPRGVLGETDLRFGFKPPRGLGLVVDATVIKGGGFLSFDPDHAEYAGILELSIKDQIQIKAIGLLTTRLPGGQPGFSLLLILTAQFPGIQLGFGFVLTGVGGLIGINRTMVVDVLRAGIRNRTVDSILFPPNPVQNAPKIISDLKAIFPPVEGRYVFGPMLELGWGTPVVVKARLGVFIELPAPIRLAILGQLKANLPTEEAPLVKLNLDAVGIVEFEKKSLSLDATLYDSMIVAYALSGDMALRLTWGEQPNFALSVGGLNPRFTPPPGFPTLRRLTLSMGSGENPRLSLETYMALTSNTAQFGARLELRAQGGGLAVHGFLSFDALFIFVPFSFVTDISAGVDLLRGSSVLMSIHLDFTLSGPTPWHAWGKASLHILFFSVSVHFDATWGEETQISLPAIDAKSPFLQALGEPSSWSAALPRQTELGVSLAPVKPSANEVLVHPLGQLTVAQKVVPLNQTITKFGAGAPAGANYFTISKVSFNGSTRTHDYVEDYFAPAQFQEMNDADALTSSSFKLMDAGARVGAAAAVAGKESTVEVLYSTQIIDDPLLPSQPVGIYRPSALVYFAQLRQSAAELSPVRRSGEAKFSVPGAESAVDVSELGYVVASTDDLSIRGDISDAAGAHEMATRQRLAQYLDANPDERGAIQVVPRHEAVAV